MEYFDIGHSSKSQRVSIWAFDGRKQDLVVSEECSGESGHYEQQSNGVFKCGPTGGWYGSDSYEASGRIDHETKNISVAFGSFGYACDDNKKAYIVSLLKMDYPDFKIHVF